MKITLKLNNQWPVLQVHDRVEIIAPAARCSLEVLEKTKQLLANWQLDYRLSDNLFGDDLLCANDDATRFKHLKSALENPNVKAIFCARGGYGSARLLPWLEKLSKPSQPKLFVGMSDITALNLFLVQKWQWPVVHASVNPDIFSEKSLQALHDLLFHKQMKLPEFLPLNQAAEKLKIMEGTVIGGNLSLIQTSIGTSWQIDAGNKILLLEETSERGYRVDRLLNHLKQAGIFKEVKAILFGDFIKGEEPDGRSFVMPVLKRFSEEITVPVFQCTGIGHDKTNYPVPLGVSITLQP